jgi:predicted nucleic acid-binding protein
MADAADVEKSSKQVALVFDASAVFNFGHRGNLTELLQVFRTTQRLVVTQEVMQEVLVEESFDYSAFLADLFDVVPLLLPENLRLDLLADGLDLGEISTIGAALALRSVAVIDERAARMRAKRMGIRLTGTLGLLGAAVHAGALTDLQALHAVARMRAWRAADGSAGGFRVRATDGFRSFRDYVAQFD